MASLFFPAATRSVKYSSSIISMICVPHCTSPGTSHIFNPLAAAPPPRFFSSSEGARPLADENLVRLLQDRISTVCETMDEDWAVPENFPFRIVDNLDQSRLILKRNFPGENIEVNVNWESSSDGKYNGNYFDVTIHKRNNKYLALSCCRKAQKITILSMNVDFNTECKNFPNEYRCLKDENLEKAFLKYLAARGVDIFLFENILDPYCRKMKSKYGKYIIWLNNIRDFVG